jgi:hypothetical protein
MNSMHLRCTTVLSLTQQALAARSRRSGGPRSSIEFKVSIASIAQATHVLLLEGTFVIIHNCMRLYLKPYFASHTKKSAISAEMALVPRALGGGHGGVEGEPCVGDCEVELRNGKIILLALIGACAGRVVSSVSIVGCKENAH